jgi:8-oxo-dGTP pyrophosphatase MutT (NUDIX family)
MKNRGPFTVKNSKTVYKNPWIEVKEDSVIRPDGKEGIFGTVDYGKGVSVVALNEKRDVYLVKEFFYAIKQEGLALPTGGVDAGETFLAAAKRELREEAGIIAKTWEKIGITDPLTMILSCPHELFLATDLTFTTQEEPEITFFTVPFEKAYEMVLQGEITHAPSCIAILKAKIYLDEKKGY